MSNAISDGESAPTASAGALVGPLCQAVLDAHRDEHLDAVAVSRASAGWYAGVVFASDDRATRLEELQEELGSGPGPSALTLQSPVLVPDLAAHGRSTWTVFALEAGLIEVASVLAFPLQIGATGLGLLTLHGTQPATLREETLGELLRLCDTVALALLAPELVLPLSVDGAGLLDDGHAVTHQAVGMVSVQLGSPLEDAMVALRARAFSSETTVADLAREVVARRVTFRDSEGAGG